MPLADAVPVQAGSVCSQRVLDRNFDDVPPIRMDLRSRILPIDQEAISRLSVKIAGAVCDFKIIRHSYRSVGPTEVEIRFDAKLLVPAASSKQSVFANMVSY
jgi:hypothetical protein